MLSNDEFELYKNESGGCSTRCEKDLVSEHLNEIDGIIDFNTLNNLKEFSSKIVDLDKKIKSKTFDLNNCTSSSSRSIIDDNITNSNNTFFFNINNNSKSSSSITNNTITSSNKSKIIQRDIDELTRRFSILLIILCRSHSCNQC
jgi:flagellar motor switch protein FliG